MANTPKISMPEISESQASKYLTHNTALRIIDTLCQATVIDKDLTEPPGSPSDGDTYIVGATPSGGSDWTGEDDSIAYYDGSSWLFRAPSEGWRVWVVDEDQAYVYVGSSDGWQIEQSITSTFLGLGDTPASFSGQAYQVLRVNSGETALEFEDNSYDVGGSWNGNPDASAVILRLPMVRSIEFPDDFSGSQGVVGTAPTSQADFLIKRDATTICTMSFAGSATTATFSSTSAGVEPLSAGDVLTVVAPSPQDATLSGIGFSLKGYKV